MTFPLATFSDPTGPLVDALDRYVGNLAVDLVNELRVTNRWPIAVTSGVRTPEQQAALVRAGRSRDLNSKHLQGRAFDLDWLGLDRNAVPRGVWDVAGPLGESLGLTWGGRWTSFVDVGHFEL
jgi:peptidoglycan L-alanyl-D-glutamate endopeptidase CwlK